MNIEQQQAAFEADYQAGRAPLQSQKPEPNNLMLSAVLRMLFEMVMVDPISRMQFYQRAQQALNELEALQSQDVLQQQKDREDALRYQWLRKHWFTMSSDYTGGCVKFRTGLPRYSEATEKDVDAAIDLGLRIEGEGE